MNLPGGAGRYEMRGVLGEGGHATVYRAFDHGRGHEVALKALLPHFSRDADLRQRFADEAAALTELQHSGIVRVFDVEAAGQWPFFTMELIEGVTLADLLARGRGLAPEEAAGLLASLASALDYLHAAGLVHRDLKPANVMVDTHGRVVLMDLGIARVVDNAGRTVAGTAIGTPETMAPEQVRGQAVGPAADIYALGVLAYQVLSGRPPFAGDTAYVLHAQAYEAPPPLQNLRPDLPAPLCRAVEAALAKEPGRRPASAGAFVGQLTGASPPTAHRRRADAPTLPNPRSAEPDPTVPQPWPTASSGNTRTDAVRPALVIAAVLGALLLTVLAITGIALSKSRSATEPATRTSLTSTTATAATSIALATTSVATTTAPTAAPTQTQTPAPPPTATPALAIDSFVVSAVEEWAQGSGELQGCYRYRNAVGGGLRVRVTRAGARLEESAADGPLHPLAAGSGSPCNTVPPVAGVPPGDYVAHLVDDQWRELGSYAFTIKPRAAPPPPARAAAQPPRPPDLSLRAPIDIAHGPSVRITEVTPAGPAFAGETFEFRVLARNTGDTGAGGSITVSSPNAARLDANVEACGTAAKAATVSPGDRISIFTGGTVTTGAARYWLGEAQFNAFPQNASCTLVVRAPVPASGALTFYLRTTARGADGGLVSLPPQPGFDRDQQNLSVYTWTVSVEQR